MNRPVAQMNLGDFSSVVQLGVGLHAGTALLQSLAEFTNTPLLRRIERLRLLADAKAKHDSKFADCSDQACNLLADLEVKRVQFFNEYKQLAAASAGIAISLCLVLAAIAFFAAEPAPVWVGVLIVLFSYGPAASFLLFLHRRWTKNTVGLVESVVELEGLIFRSR